MKSVTLETKCWEGDWKKVLKTDRLKVLTERNCYPFAESIVLINNVQNYRQVCKYARRAVEKGFISRYVIVKDYEEEALKFFGVSRDSLGRGHVYSIAEFVGLYICKTDFLLHFSSDSIPAKSYNWIPKAIDLLDSDYRLSVANLTWNGNYQSAKEESFQENENFYIGYGFSDQCYLVRLSDFRAPIYNEYHPASRRYPIYGGELFEKRVDSWMQNNGRLRATYKHGAYVHEPHPITLLGRLRNLRKRLCRISFVP